MKILALLIAIAFCQTLACGACAALDLTFSQAVLSGLPGSTLTFSGTLTNTDSSELFINGDSYTVSVELLAIDDTAFWTNVPSSLLNSQTWTGELFDVQTDASIAPGNYWGSFTILGGDDSEAQSELTTQNFQVTVVPECGSLSALALGLVGFVAAKRKIA